MMLSAIFGTIIIVLVTVAIGIYIERKTKLVPKPEELAARAKPPTTHDIGEAPATALRAGDAQLANVRKGQRCPACRGAMTAAADTDDHVRYNDRDMLVLHFSCSRCATKKSLYIEPTTSTSRPQ